MPGTGNIWRSSAVAFEPAPDERLDALLDDGRLAEDMGASWRATSVMIELWST
jgi:hypothetical protein